MYFTFTKKQLILTAIITAISVVSCLIMSNNGLYQTFYAKANRQLPIYYVNTDQKKVAISFDCAWGVDYTDELLSVMQEKNVKCTFFTVEFWSKKYPEYLKKISDYGHELGTHSATHPHMSKLSKQAIVNQLTTSCKAISDITGKTPIVFRPPYGEYNDLVINTAKELGLYSIQWDVDSLDWKDLSANQIKERVVKRVKNGSIVLFHNQGLHTAEALPSIIDVLKAQGYNFVTVGELIYKDNYYMSADGGQVRNS